MATLRCLPETLHGHYAAWAGRAGLHGLRAGIRPENIGRSDGEICGSGRCAANLRGKRKDPRGLHRAGLAVGYGQATVNTTLAASGETVPSAATARTSSLNVPAVSAT